MVAPFFCRSPFVPASLRRALVCAALVSLTTPVLARAQDADSPSSLVGATMLDLQADAWLQPGPGRSLLAQGEFRRVVADHWELGFAPALSGYTGPHASSVGVAVEGMANYMIGAGRARAYVGAYGGGSGGSHGGGSFGVGAQVGSLYFPAPTTALRVELSARRWDSFSTRPLLGGSLALEPWIGRHGSERPTLPSTGVADASLSAFIEFNSRRERHLDLMIAPFLSSWAQIGGEYEAYTLPMGGAWHTTHRFNGFARLYAPLSPAAMPFVHGFMETTRSAFDGSWPMSYGLMGGVRHNFNRGAAFDAGLQWRRYQLTEVMTVLDAPEGTSILHQRPDELTLQARMVVELHAR